jgi:hypothetical protein
MPSKHIYCSWLQVCRIVGMRRNGALINFVNSTNLHMRR